MKTRFVAAAVLAALLCASPARAEVPFMGAGARPCSLLNANAAADPAQTTTTMLIFSWVQGFLSGMNAMALNLPQKKALFDLDALPDQAQWTHLLAYCKANSGALIATAALDLGTTRLMKRGN